MLLTKPPIPSLDNICETKLAISSRQRCQLLSEKLPENGFNQNRYDATSSQSETQKAQKEVSIPGFDVLEAERQTRLASTEAQNVALGDIIPLGIILRLW